MIARSLISTASCASSRHPSHGRPSTPPHSAPTSPPHPPAYFWTFQRQACCPLPAGDHSARKRRLGKKESVDRRRASASVHLPYCKASPTVPSGSFLLTDLRGSSRGNSSPNLLSLFHISDIGRRALFTPRAPASIHYPWTQSSRKSFDSFVVAQGSNPPPAGAVRLLT